MKLQCFALLVQSLGKKPFLQHVHLSFMTSLISPGTQYHEPQGRQQRPPEPVVAGRQLTDEMAT